MELIVTKVNGLGKSNQWKDIWYHEYNCIATIEGEDKECRVSIGSKSEVPPEFKAGTHNVDEKPEYMGKKQFKLIKDKPAFTPSSSGSKMGYTAKSYTSRNETSIVAQSSLKAAIEYSMMANPKSSVSDVLKVADQFMDWVKAKG